MQRSTQWCKGVVWYHPGLCVRNFHLNAEITGQAGFRCYSYILTKQPVSFVLPHYPHTTYQITYQSPREKNYSTKQIVNGELAIMQFQDNIPDQQTDRGCVLENGQPTRCELRGGVHSNHSFIFSCVTLSRDSQANSGNEATYFKI